MHKKQKKRTQGFTLVELIVVLVILAILIALLVPALTGYIDKANEKATIAECRQAVVATQSTATGLYGKGEFSDAKILELKSDILKLAEVNGTIDDFKFIDGATVGTLIYTSKKNITVKYEDKKYTVLDKNSSFANAQSITSLSDKLNKDNNLASVAYPTRTKNFKSI